MLFLRPPRRFLCGTVNDFVAEVGKAYERATENREEADAMAKKVNAGVRYVSACVTAAWERTPPPLRRFLGCTVKNGSAGIDRSLASFPRVVFRFSLLAEDREN